MRSVESVLLTVGVLALVAAAVTTAALAAGKHHGPRPYAHHSTKKGGEGSRDRGRHGDEQGKDEQGEGGHRRVCKGHRGVCGLDVYWLRSSIQGDVFEIRGGQLALQKSSNTAVRTLAQRLITDALLRDLVPDRHPARPRLARPHLGLTIGLTSAGMTPETAIAAVLLYRISTYYLPPAWDFGAMLWLQRNRYL